MKVMPVTRSQPLASALVYGYATMIVVPRPPTRWCPECKGQFEGRMPGHVYGSNWDFVPCRTCNHNDDPLLDLVPGDRLQIASWPDPPIDGRYGDVAVVPPSGIVTNGGWIAQVWDGTTVVDRWLLPLGEIVGLVDVVDCLPIIDPDTRFDTDALIVWPGGTVQRVSPIRSTVDVKPFFQTFTVGHWAITCQATR